MVVIAFNRFIITPIFILLGLLFYYGFGAVELVIFLVVWIYLFKSPDKLIHNPQQRIFYSPCEGRVRSINYTNRYLIISVFVGLLDNHTQYFPTQSILIGRKKIDGNYKPAYNEDSGYNKRIVNTLKDTKNGFVYSITQMVGIIARRLKTLSKLNKIYNPGERLGYIMLGSRVDIKIPIYHVKNILINVGDKITPGEPIVTLL